MHLQSPYTKIQPALWIITVALKRPQFPTTDGGVGEGPGTRMEGMSGMDHILLQADLFPPYTGRPVPSWLILSLGGVGGQCKECINFPPYPTIVFIKRNQKGYKTCPSSRSLKNLVDWLITCQSWARYSGKVWENYETIMLFLALTSRLAPCTLLGQNNVRHEWARGALILQVERITLSGGLIKSHTSLLTNSTSCLQVITLQLIEQGQGSF